MGSKRSPVARLLPFISTPSNPPRAYTKDFAALASTELSNISLAKICCRTRGTCEDAVGHSWILLLSEVAHYALDAAGVWCISAYLVLCGPTCCWLFACCFCRLSLHARCVAG